MLTSSLALSCLLQPLPSCARAGGKESCFVFPGSVESTLGRDCWGQAQPGLCSSWFSCSDCKTSCWVAVRFTFLWGLAAFTLEGRGGPNLGYIPVLSTVNEVDLCSPFSSSCLHGLSNREWLTGMSASRRTQLMMRLCLTVETLSVNGITLWPSTVFSEFECPVWQHSTPWTVPGTGLSRLKGVNADWLLLKNSKSSSISQLIPWPSAFLGFMMSFIFKCVLLR